MRQRRTICAAPLLSAHLSRRQLDITPVSQRVAAGAASKASWMHPATRPRGPTPVRGNQVHVTGASRPWVRNHAVWDDEFGKPCGGLFPMPLRSSWPVLCLAVWTFQAAIAPRADPMNAKTASATQSAKVGCAPLRMLHKHGRKSPRRRVFGQECITDKLAYVNQPADVLVPTGRGLILLVHGALPRYRR